MKAIIQSYTPQECERIADGRQTIKVCKTAPKDTPFKVYIYCTKDGYAYRCRIDENSKLAIPELWNGKVIGEYVCKKVDKYRFSNYEAEYDVTHDASQLKDLQELLVSYKPAEIICNNAALQQSYSLECVKAGYVPQFTLYDIVTNTKQACMPKKIRK